MSEDEVAALQAEANQRTISDFFRVFISPEIGRRQAAGSVPNPYNLEKAQVVFNVDLPIQIRLNDEVAGKMIVAVTEDAKPTLETLEKGQPVPWDAVKGIADVRLTGKDANAAHMTMISIPGAAPGYFLTSDTTRRV